MSVPGRRIWIAGAAAIVSLLALPGGALGGGTTDIAVEDNVFLPPDATNLAFHFAWDPDGDQQTNHRHNIRQDDGFFDSGHPKKSGQFNVLLPSAGKFHYYCEVHGSKSGGMDGVIRKYVYRNTAPVPNQSQLIWWGSEDGPARYRHDVQFRVGDGRWRTWKTDTKAVKGNFGAHNEPVDGKPGKIYAVRARTQKGQDESKRSGWSPAFTFDLVP